MNKKNNINNKESIVDEKSKKKETKKPNFLVKYKIPILISVLFFILMLASFATVYNSYFNVLQNHLFSQIKMPLDNLYFMNYKLSFPKYFAIDFLVINLVLTIFFILYLKKMHVIKDWDDFTNKVLFFIIVFILYFFFFALTLANELIFLQLLLFVSLLVYFFIYSIYYDIKNNINLAPNNYLFKNEFLILTFYSIFILILYIFDYKSWKYSYIGDEWAFFEYAKGIISGRVPLNIFSENGVYGYHPVLSSVWQAFIMFITDKGLFGWKLSSALIVPLSIIPFYVWNKLVFNRTVAIISTIVFSLANAMMAFSHIGYNNIQTIFFYITTLCLLEIALRKKSLFYLILTSFVAGLGFYTFYSSRLIILLLIIYILFHPEKKKFKIFDYILPFILYVFIISPIIFQVDFFYHMLRQTAIGGSEIKNPAERPIYFVLNFIHSFFAFLSKSKNSHYMIYGLVDIFSAIGVLFGFIWIIVAFISDWRARFLLISYLLLVFFIGALHQYHYPVNTRLIFLIPILATFAGIGFSRMAYLLTYFKKSKQVYIITVMVFCFIIFLINCFIFYVKMPSKLRFTMQAYVIKFLQQYEKFEKIVVVSSNIVNLNDIIKIYNLNGKTIICNLNQFEIMLKENKVNNKVVIFDYNIAANEKKIMQFIKPGYTYNDNENDKILFYIYDFVKDTDYYNGFYEFWVTGKTDYKLPLPVVKKNIKQEIKDKDTIKKVITYKMNNKTKKFKLFIYKNFQFEKSYSAMRNSEIKNYKITRLSFDIFPPSPSDIMYDNNLNILFVSDSKEKKIYKFLKEKQDKFKISDKIDIPGKLLEAEKENTDILFLTVNPTDKILYALDSLEGKIYEINYEGNIKKEIIESDYLKYASDIVYYEKNNYLVISNPEENIVMIFDIINCNLINAYSTTLGIGEGQLNRPVSSEFTKENFILIVDSLNGRVQLFDNNIKYLKNFRIGISSRTQWPDILYFDNFEKPYFVVSQPALKKIFIYFLNENVFRYISLYEYKNYKFLNPSKITKCYNDIYLLDNIGKTIVKLDLPEDFIFETIDFPTKRGP